MARIAIGDVQGCHAELRALVARTGFRSDRDQLWFVGDLVNRGPQSLEVLRYVRALGDNAIVVLGNHDLHLLAIALGGLREARPDDTLDAVLAAPDREPLLEWLLHRPLAWHDATSGDLLIHAGLVPQWSAARAIELAHWKQRKAAGCTAEGLREDVRQPARSLGRGPRRLGTAPLRDQRAAPACATARPMARSTSSSRTHRPRRRRRGSHGSTSAPARAAARASSSGTGRRSGCCNARTCWRSTRAACGADR